MITDVLNNYDQEEITIGVIGSHSALDVLDGAKRVGFKTAVIIEKGREEPYTRYTRIIDDTIVVDNFSDIFDIQEQLIEKNCIFIPNRSFVVYCGYNRIERDFKIPIFGSRELLKTEERTGFHNYYRILQKANIRYPKVYKNAKEIDGPVIYKIQHAKQRVERGFFVAKNREDFEEELEKRIKNGSILEEDLHEASIE
ncbi:MAG: DUF1246 domain-containing protein, partial [Candidatus Heimdallarchaeota archaeon]|nr:DUF1246 domain-containing protein [Candidatus Heimdallarchaeota archaeon]